MKGPAWDKPKKLGRSGEGVSKKGRGGEFPFVTRPPPLTLYFCTLLQFLSPLLAFGKGKEMGATQAEVASVITSQFFL